MQRRCSFGTSLRLQFVHFKYYEMDRIPTWLLVTLLAQGAILHCPDNCFYAPGTAAAANCGFFGLSPADVTLCEQTKKKQNDSISGTAQQGGVQVSRLVDGCLGLCVTPGGLKESVLGNLQRSTRFAKPQQQVADRDDE